jgi:hypothetical protein
MRLHSVSVDRDIASRQPRDTRRGRAQPQRFVQHLHGVPEGGHVVGRQLSIADGRRLGGHPILDVGVVAQDPQRVRERRRGGVMAGEHEDQQVIGDVVVRDRLPGLRIGRREQGLHQRRVPSGVRAAGPHHLVGDRAHSPDRGAGPAARRCRHPPRCAHRP